MAGVVASFTIMAIAGREASFELDPIELLLYRSIFGIAAVLAICAARRRIDDIRTSRLGLHVVRNMFHFSGTVLWFYAVFTIPLAQVFAFEFSTPLWAAVLAPFFLGERLTLMRKATIAVGFAGILVVARPGATELSPGVAAAALCAVGFAVSAIATRRLVRDASVTCILFWMAVMQTAISLAIAGFDGDIAVPSRASALPLLLVSITGLTAHYCLTTALRLAPAVVVMPLDFARLPIIAIAGMIIYAEPLDAFVIAGACIIMGANYVNVRNEAKSVKK